MAETEKKQNGTKAFLMRTAADPVLVYVTIVMMSIMYHYRSELALIYGIVTFIIGWGIFRIFDFINKHHLIGTFIYIILFILFTRTSSFLTVTGRKDYPISFGLWFLTPQDSMLYNKWYTMAIYSLFLIFMLSVIYYFTRVRYRIFMNFLIFIIPFAIYGKEYEEMPIGYIIALSVGFVLILAMFRQLSDTEKTVVINKPEAWRSAAVFTVLFALVSSLIPKPEIEADREALETLINADELTDRMLSMLSSFRDDSDGEQFRNTSNSILYYASSVEPLRLKTSTFTSYDYGSDSWKISSIDSVYRVTDQTPVSFFSNGGITEAVQAAAAYDSDFAELYGLTELTELELEIPDQRIVALYSTYQRGDTAPVPQGAKALTRTSYNGALGTTGSGVLFSDETDFSYNETFSFLYEPDGFLDINVNERAVEIISGVDDYIGMLSAATDVMRHRYFYETDDSDIWQNYYRILNYGAQDYEEYLQQLLDYGGNTRIRDLAQELTAGIDSEYEKAKVLERYFIDNGFIYDQTYRKEKGDNAETFLFNTKKGVCYEYATSMTLLARAAGIPARYCEGFNMQTKLENSANYVVRGSDAHGFPELYIKGYGWMTFEPTLSNDPVMETGRQASRLLTRSGVIILVLSVLALAAILLYPFISHRIFIFVNKRRAPNAAIKRTMRRICRLYRIDPTNTAHEAENAVRNISGADIGGIAVLFERSEYGGETLTEEHTAKAIEQYSAAYEALREAKKKARKKNKRSRSVTETA